MFRTDGQVRSLSRSLRSAVHMMWNTAELPPCLVAVNVHNSVATSRRGFRAILYSLGVPVCKDREPVKRVAVAGLLLPLLLLLASAPRAQATTSWKTIATLHDIGQNTRSGSALSRKPVGLRLVVTTNVGTATVFWTLTCSTGGALSAFRYGTFVVPAATPSYHILPVPAKVGWCSVVYTVETSGGNTALLVEQPIGPAPGTAPGKTGPGTNVVLFRCTGTGGEGEGYGFDYGRPDDDSGLMVPLTIPWSARMPLDTRASNYHVVAYFFPDDVERCSVTVNWGTRSVTSTGSGSGSDMNWIDVSVRNDNGIGTKWSPVPMVWG